MATPAKANFKLKANSYFTQVWQIKNGEAPFDVTGYTYELQVKKNKGANTVAFLTLTLDNGITVEDAAQGKLRIEIEPQPSITAATKFFYDLVAIKDGKPYVWLEGEITFEPGVSYMD